MKSKKSALLLILVFVLLIGGAYVLYNQLGSQIDAPQLATQPPQETVPSDPAPSETATPSTPETAPTEATEPTQTLPDFTVYDLEGNPVKLSDFRGKPVVLNFWSSNCGPCQLEMPDFQETYAELGDEIYFLMINMTDGIWDTVDSAHAFLLENGYTFPVFYDTDRWAAYVFGVTSLPTTYFLDASGNAIAYGMGALSKETLLRGIAMITPSDK